MEITIENYRGHEIRFDNDRETFLCDIDDSRSVKKSYSALKKFIDEFIKENNSFKEFKIVRIPDSSFGKDGIIKVVGIRKDGRLIGNLNGENFQISDYDLKYYCLYNPDNDIYFNKLKELEEDFKLKRIKYNSDKIDIIEKMNIVKLSDYKKTIE